MLNRDLKIHFPSDGGVVLSLHKNILGVNSYLTLPEYLQIGMTIGGTMIVGKTETDINREDETVGTIWTIPGHVLAIEEVEKRPNRYLAGTGTVGGHVCRRIIQGPGNEAEALSVDVMAAIRAGTNMHTTKVQVVPKKVARI